MGLACGSQIGWIRNMLGIEGLSYLTVDEPELVTEIINTNASLSLRCLEETLARSDKFDYGHYWEDICFNMGPLVNPAYFRETAATGASIPWSPSGWSQALTSCSQSRWGPGTPASPHGGRPTARA